MLRISSLVILSIFIIVGGSCNDQSTSTPVAEQPKNFNKEGIRIAAEAYTDAFEKKEWDKILSFIHPRIFDYVGREQFSQELEKTFSTDEMDMFITDYITDSISAIRRDGDAGYALVSSRYTLVMALDTSSYEPGSEEFATVCSTTKAEFKTDTVECNPDRSRIEIHTKEKIYAIFQPSNKRWYFLGADEDVRDIVNKIVPPKIRKELGQ